MIKLTSKKMEQLVKEKTGYDATYLGIFVDNYNRTIEPIKHAFVHWKNGVMKILSVLEKQIIEHIRRD